jgi:hypothetical protein
MLPQTHYSTFLCEYEAELPGTCHEQHVPRSFLQQQLLEGRVALMQ